MTINLVHGILTLNLVSVLHYNTQDRCFCLDWNSKQDNRLL